MGVDAVIARLASRQDGIVTRAELEGAGVTRDAIKHRLATGRLIAVNRGVYTVGHAAIADLGRLRAGLYAAGPHAVVSRDSATYLHKLIAYLPLPVEVTITAGNRRRRPGPIIHRASTLETTRRHGLPVTTPRQTLADLGWPTTLARAALARRLIGPDDIPDRLELTPTESELEERMRRLCRDAGLPQPIFQHRIGPYRVAFAWPAHHVLVETDGYATHGTREAFEADRARDADLAAPGYIVIRFTWRQLRKEPTRVTARLAAALALNASTPVAP